MSSDRHIHVDPYEIFRIFLTKIKKQVVVSKNIIILLVLENIYRLIQTARHGADGVAVLRKVHRVEGVEFALVSARSR